MLILTINSGMLIAFDKNKLVNEAVYQAWLSRKNYVIVLNDVTVDITSLLSCMRLLMNIHEL